MASSFVSFSILAILFTCFATLSLSISCTFANENHIRLPSDSVRRDVVDEDDDCDPSFSSIPIDAIYQFGDSLSDTGNLIRYDPSANCGKWPYGETYFDKPSGRCCDGLIMIDYFAKFLNLPFIDPYLNKDGNFTHGVNFAVDGATALDSSTLEQKYNVLQYGGTNLSLSVQLGWFKSHLESYYVDVSERRRKLSRGLFMMGEVGGNDFNYAFSQGKTLENAYQMAPDVVQKIRSAMEDIIELGVFHIVVPGNFPIGCVPMYLHMFKTNDINMYDELKCLKQYNDFSKFFNDLLQQTIWELQLDHPNVAIIYMDYYGAMKEIYQDADLLGFNKNTILEGCCGSHENFCGTGDGVHVCENPQEHISWDGVHLTQHAYHVLAKRLIRYILFAFQNVAYDM